MTQEELIEIIHKAEKEQVTELDLSMSGIRQLPKEIGQLKNLCELNLMHNYLKELPKEIIYLKSLTKIYLRYNQFYNVPIEVTYLKNLKELNISANQLTSLPKEIGQLKNLTQLDLGRNLLTILPEEIGELKNLGILRLRHNDLKQLPKKISQLNKLKELYLDSNQLRDFSEEICQLRNLTKLHLEFNQFNELPSRIGQLNNLTEFYLQFNQLSELPSEIGLLSNLRELNLLSNQLKYLPRQIGQLRNLSKLYLMDNKLEELPKEITQLRSLETLYLNDNQLSHLPNELVQLKNLKELHLEGNPLTSPPIEIAAQGISAIRNYFKKSAKTGGRTLYEAKLMIVGQGSVGKTCLMKRLISDEYPGEQATTEGIDIQKWELPAPDQPKTPMTLNVWDFGGQEIYHATHQFFLTRRSLYIFVWDARQEEEYGRIDYWLNTVETFAADSPVLIIMNKSDERDKDLNLKDLKERFPQIVGAGKVSAKKGTGISGLRKIIQEQAWKLPLMGTVWPASWLAVRRAVEKTDKFYIPHRAYLNVCRKAGIRESEAGTLSRYLHDLGIILHFHEDILLKDTVIIKPEWGTDAVYKVLDADSVRRRNGVLYHSDLPEIWNDRALYPPEKYAALLRLMANFELAFPVGDGNRHIVAELLSPKEAKYDWDPQDCLQFEYHYDFLPAGVMTRLIVRMHEFLMKRDGAHLCWREGAYFEYGGTQAMIRINPYTRIAVIQIHGNAKREFLAIVRSHFAAIHKTIRKIRFKEKIPCICSPDCAHRFDYNVLLKCEEKNKHMIMCEKSIEDVNVGKLLDGIEKADIRREKSEFDSEPEIQTEAPKRETDPPRFKDGRRLAAIMFTDIVGFSKKMECDEDNTVRLLDRHCDIIRPLLKKHHGTEIKTIGDAFMVMFRSAADAVKCAVEIQEAHRESGGGLVPRIGIHIGDLIFKNGDVFGDSVNIAARIEPLADPGGICISEDVYSIVKKKIRLNAVKMENVSMKNIKDPPGVYKVLPEGYSGDNVIYLSRKQ
jgi:small GTP-binding protein